MSEHRDGHEWFRADVSRGIVTSGGSAGQDAHVIKGVSVITMGVIQDGRGIVDKTTLEQVVSLGNAKPNGLRSRFDHPAASSTSMGKHLGRLRSFRRDGDKVLADLHLAAIADRSPDGELRTYVEGLADEDPDAFGISLAVVRNKAAEGEQGAEPALTNMRLAKVLAGDVVDAPATNEGLFHDMAGTPASTAAAFLDRYYRERGFTLGSSKKGEKQMTDEEKKAKEAAEQLAAKTGDSVEPGGEDDAGNSPGNGEAATATIELAVLNSESLDAKIAEATTKARKQERDRAKAIRGVAEKLGLKELGDQLVDMNSDELSEEAAVKRLLNKFSGLETQQPVGASLGFEVTGDRRDRFNEAASHAIMERAGFNLEEFGLSSEQQTHAREATNLSLFDMAKQCLSHAGLPVQRMSRDDIIRQALRGPGVSPSEQFAFGGSTSDYPYLLANVASKSMMKGYEQQPSTWQTWCAKGSVPDFKQFTRVALSEADDLAEVKEGAEFTDSKLSEAREQGVCATYGKLFTVTRQTIINDDLDQITKQPRRFGGSAARLPDNLLYPDLMSGSSMGPTMGDTNKLFIDNAGAAGSNWFDDGDVPSVTSVLDTTNGEGALNKAIFLLRSQKGLAGKSRINLVPSILMVPIELEMGARVQMNSSASVDDYKNVGVINPWKGLATILVVPHLSDSGITGYSTTAWYLIADRNQITVYEIVFLNGVATPFLDQEEGFQIDGRKFKVRMDVGVKAIDRKGIVKSKGAS